MLTHAVPSPCSHSHNNVKKGMLEAFYQLYNTIKTERFSYKSGCAMLVAKLLKQDWPIVELCNNLDK